MTSAATAGETHQIILILDDDLLVTEGLAAGLAGPRRTIITCNDIESAEMVVEWMKPSHVVSDVRLSGAFSFEGLDFIRFVKRHSSDSRIILMTGDAPDAMQLEASERGAVAFLQKPFEVAELEAILNLMAPFRVGAPDWPDIIRVPLLEAVLAGDNLYTVFQPVVRLTSGEAVGFEALTRLESESPLRNPERLFRYAARKHRVADLEVECIRHSLQAAAALPPSAPVFLNVHPTVFSTAPQIRDVILSQATLHDIQPSRIVLEITEQATFGDELRALTTIEGLKASEIRFALDDVGVAYSHLPFIGRIRPAFIKISQH
ncbi:MAG TPA: EAL domain-containing protein, partial [Thermoanaerobaculia bacterium]